MELEEKAQKGFQFLGVQELCVNRSILYHGPPHSLRSPRRAKSERDSASRKGERDSEAVAEERDSGRTDYVLARVTVMEHLVIPLRIRSE